MGSYDGETVATGAVLGFLLGMLVVVFVALSLTSSPIVLTGNIAAAPSASADGDHENILITLSNHPNTVIQCQVNLGNSEGQAQAYSLMTLAVGQHVSIMRYNQNYTVFG